MTGSRLFSKPSLCLGTAWELGLWYSARGDCRDTATISSSPFAISEMEACTLPPPLYPTGKAFKAVTLFFNYFSVQPLAKSSSWLGWEMLVQRRNRKAQIFCSRSSETKAAMDAVCLLQGAEPLLSPRPLKPGIAGGGDPGAPDCC